MDSTLNSTLAQVSLKLSVDRELVEAIYDSYWAYFREQVSKEYYPYIPLDERKKAFVNINLPYIGKLFVSENKLYKYDRQNYYYKNAKLKKNKTNRLSGTSD